MDRRPESRALGKPVFRAKNRITGRGRSAAVKALLSRGHDGASRRKRTIVAQPGAPGALRCRPPATSYRGENHSNRVAAQDGRLGLHVPRVRPLVVAVHGTADVVNVAANKKSSYRHY